MTVSELIDKLTTLNPDMTVVLGIDESLEDICFSDSRVIQVKFNETDEKENLFVLCPCYCEEDFENESEINSKPELN